MKFVAFLRNVNLGQPRSPTRVQLETAFGQAGASEAVSFMSNGTVVFSVARSRQAPSTAKRACARLRQVCGLKEPVFVCSLARLTQLAAADPFAAFADAPVSERCISFFEPAATGTCRLPLEADPKDCVVFRLEAGVALSVTYNANGKIGYPTPVLEKALSTPVTTRNWRTIVRLLARHACAIR